MLPVTKDEARTEEARQKGSYKSLDALIGEITRRNKTVMRSAFALSTNNLHQMVLWKLSKSGPKTSKEIHEATNISKGMISKIIKELHDAGIVTKSSGSNGSEPLDIRQDLKEHFRKHADHVERLVRSAFNVLSEEEQHSLHYSLSRVLERLNTIGEEINAKPSTYIELREPSKNLPSTGTDTIDGGTWQCETQNRDQSNKAKYAQAEDHASTEDGVISIVERQARFLYEVTEKITFHRPKRSD